MLILGTFLVQRPDPETWRVGVQLGAWRGWFLERCGGALRTTSYGPGDFALRSDPPGDEPPGEAFGGVREPRRPSPAGGAASVAVDPADPLR